MNRITGLKSCHLKKLACLLMELVYPEIETNRRAEWSRRRQNRATKAHAALVRSVSWSRVLIVRSLWPGSALFQDRPQLFKHPLSNTPEMRLKRNYAWQARAGDGRTETTCQRELRQKGSYEL